MTIEKMTEMRGSVHSPFLPDVLMVEDADLVMLSLAVAARDEGLALQHVVLLLLELGLGHLAVDCENIVMNALQEDHTDFFYLTLRALKGRRRGRPCLPECR